MLRFFGRRRSQSSVRLVQVHEVYEDEEAFYTVTESWPRAHSYYSISTGMQIGDPRLYHFWLYQCT